MTGVRHDESTKRKVRGDFETVHRDKEKRIILMNDNDTERRLFENCRIKAKRICNPIIDWTDSDVWEYLQDRSTPINPLYKEGFCRVGCVGCPMAGKGRAKEFLAYPKFKNMYIQAFERMVKRRSEKGLVNTGTWKDGESVFRWWMEDKNLEGQISLFENS